MAADGSDVRTLTTCDQAVCRPVTGPAGCWSVATVALLGLDLTPDLARIDVPTLVVTSSGDTLIPAEATRPMAEAIPGALLEDLGPAGHLSNLEAPEAFNRLLHDHLRRCGLLSP